MIVAPYDHNRDVDIVTNQLVGWLKKRLSSKDDDYLLPIIGTTGTGKSALSLHLYELYAENPSVDFIGLDRKDFANALKKAKNDDLPRFACYDEANITRADHATSWNKDLIDVYLAIRGLQIFHIWNNPSAKKFPREFIEERIKGLIYIFTKDKDRPRLFYFFTKDNMLKMYDACKGDLSHRNIKKHAESYAFYRGWFRDYNGLLLDDYKQKKSSRMDVKVDSFFEKYGSDDVLNGTQVGKMLGVSQTTISRWHEKLGGVLIPDEDYSITAAGQKRYTQSGIEKLREYGPGDQSVKPNIPYKEPLNIDARGEREGVGGE